MTAEQPPVDVSPQDLARERLQAAVERLEVELASTAAGNSERIAALTAAVNGWAAVVAAAPPRLGPARQSPTRPVRERKVTPVTPGVG